MQRARRAACRTGDVVDQDPAARRSDRQAAAWSRSGSRPASRKVHVPDVVGKRGDRGGHGADRRGASRRIPSGSTRVEPPWTPCIATRPRSRGRDGARGTTVRINVSKGPKPISVPNVIGMPFESAESTLQGAGFAVVARGRRRRAQPAGVVVGQTPHAGTQQAQGLGDHAQVSKGPQTLAGPRRDEPVERRTRPRSSTSPASRCRRSRRSSTPGTSTAACSRRIPWAARTPKQGTTVVIVGRPLRATADRRRRRPP